MKTRDGATTKKKTNYDDNPYAQKMKSNWDREHSKVAKPQSGDSSSLNFSKKYSTASSGKKSTQSSKAPLSYEEKQKSDWERGQSKKAEASDNHKSLTTKESRTDDASMPAYAQKQKSDWERGQAKKKSMLSSKPQQTYEEKQKADWERGQATKRKSTQSSKAPLSYEEKMKSDWNRSQEIRNSEKGEKLNSDRIRRDTSSSGIKSTTKGNLKQVTGIKSRASYTPTAEDGRKAAKRAGQQAQKYAAGYAKQSLMKGFAGKKKSGR